MNIVDEATVTGVNNRIVTFFKLISRKQAIIITICFFVIVVTSAFAINILQNQLSIDGNDTTPHKTEVASLLCEWRLSVKGFFIVNITNQHDFSVFGVRAQGQFINGSLLILELTPPHDTLEPSQSYAVSQAGSEKDFENIDNIKAWGYYLVGANNTD
ncbi:MAG: hypothetical protein JSV51_07770 [Candidatus Bathyarchaeota archaeon]|nr:MAG: hypothetical protein JSV51_07770 [Candidatus Bathyarchaeota archaeon]